ncbi:beta-ribofuranosylaminobenzene 5'-phosphate synthase family protein [Natrinema hispanicum]|uniref:Beta-ribofuranosylaminobenzene 5'-phosphate synthase n=1 Tax=Natrinema hispanicum TaxID=392421 RepID=A0A1G6M488_9EURY|nr:beta-ribofuranosylaminobenzene 5'-phosphate synthase family protein [Natrinema hispanicum]SDC50134.1 beta-ribofuranosylaminobenzene 5'-phosphate synthase [Natrinema hispanicum]SET17293.1 beta-ribofuranosylaminobenzene 5'-phosphate synthase [Natrinema hispanicum]
MTTATVSVGARLHVGFQNLSLARERLYGGIGVALEEPRVTVIAEPATDIRTDDELVGRYARRAVDVLSVPGVAVTLEESLPRHVGLGSGTQLALAVLTATAHAHGLEARVREHAPAMGRGGRSGVGVATFEDGGFVVDAGHPTARFTTEPPAEGDWTVPPVVARHDLPTEWRFLVVVPDADSGRSGDDEDASMRAVVERADPAVADEIAGVVTRKLLPAAAAGRLEAFGEAIAEIGRKNGVWYTDAQGGVFRPPAGALVESLESCPVLSGIGQSSWGPVVYGVTDVAHAAEAEAAARDALAAHGLEGRVILAEPARHGAWVCTDGDRRQA